MTETIAYLGLVDDEEIILDVAALELSALDHPGAGLEPHKAVLLDIFNGVRADQGEVEPVAQARALVRVIHGQFGFSGDAQTYDAPLNADMIRVIDRRRGLPVSLAILYVAAARRLGWTADALNTPGHVLIRIGSEGEAIVVDPFSDGAIVAGGALARLVSQGENPLVGTAADAIEPMTNRMVLVRLLLNQVSRAELAGDHDRACTLLERVTTIAPACVQGWWHLARLRLGHGHNSAARDSLVAMLEMTREFAPRMEIVRALERSSV